MSVAVTLGAIIFGNITSGLSQELKISLAAQVFTVPVIFFYFHQISLISPLANILVAWTIAPLIIFGFTAAVLGIIPAYFVYGLLSYFIFIVNVLSRIPWASMQF